MQVSHYCTNVSISVNFQCLLNDLFSVLYPNKMSINTAETDFSSHLSLKCPSSDHKSFDLWVAVTTQSTYTFVYGYSKREEHCGDFWHTCLRFAFRNPVWVARDAQRQVNCIVMEGVLSYGRYWRSGFSMKLAFHLHSHCTLYYQFWGIITDWGFVVKYKWNQITHVGLPGEVSCRYLLQIHCCRFKQWLC